MPAIRHWRAGLIASCLAVACYAVVILQGQWLHYTTRGHRYLDGMGAVAVIGGSAFRLWAGAHIRPWKGKRLVESGPYVFCRHPLYLGSLMALVGLCLIMQNTLFLLASMVLCVGTYAVKIRIEERNLAARFGAAWRAYVLRTPLLIPRWPGGRTSAPNPTVHAFDAVSELPGAIMFLVFAICAELAERFMYV